MYLVRRLPKRLSWRVVPPYESCPFDRLGRPFAWSVEHRLWKVRLGLSQTMEKNDAVQWTFDRPDPV